MRRAVDRPNVLASSSSILRIPQQARLSSRRSIIEEQNSRQLRKRDLPLLPNPNLLPRTVPQQVRQVQHQRASILHSISPRIQPVEEVEDDGGVAYVVEEDFLVVGDLSEIAVPRERCEQSVSSGVFGRWLS